MMDNRGLFKQAEKSQEYATNSTIKDHEMLNEAILQIDEAVKNYVKTEDTE